MATLNFILAIDGDMDKTGNWDLGRLPQAGDTVNIAPNPGYGISAGTLNCDYCNVLAPAGGVNGGTFNCNIGNLACTTTGGIFNGTVTLGNGSYANGGTFNYPVTIAQVGSIMGGTFNVQVTNNSVTFGGIWGGTFNVPVINNGRIQGGVFNADVICGVNSEIQGGEYHGNTTPATAIDSAISIYNEYQGINGGEAYFKRDVYNAGTISGGNWLGVVTNGYKITGGKFFNKVIQNSIYYGAYDMSEIKQWRIGSQKARYGGSGVNVGGALSC